jgi:hypothetical protein
MMPSSFMVRAKDKDGNPVMMVINPNSIEAVTFEGGANNNRTAGQDSAIQQPELRPGQSAVWQQPSWREQIAVAGFDRTPIIWWSQGPEVAERNPERDPEAA